MNRVKKDTKKINEEVKPKKKKSKFKKKILIALFVVFIFITIQSIISVRKWQGLAMEMLQNSPSVVYDTDNKKIAEFGSEKIRKNIEIKDIPEDLKNAYVSIEDQRFYKHHGVDIKRTISATGSYIIHLGNASFGASTITQQLVKNLTGDDSNKPTRKIKEWAKAAELEWCLTKDEIIGNYLNIIYVGPNIYGVESGANYYFDKSVKELDLAECAFLAGLNNAPNAYNPFKENVDNTEKIKKRTKTVLNKMHELEYINDSDYDKAIEKVENGLKFKKGKIEPESKGVYSYHTDALLSEVVSDISKDKNITKTFATNYVQMAGLNIYSTQNTSIQEKIEKEFEKNKYILKSKNNPEATSQSAMVIIDHKNGYVVGCVGGLGKKKEARGFNRATQAVRQTGSSSKPLTVIAPALAEKIVTPVSKFDDKQTTFIDNNNEEYSPTNYNNYLGEITLRRAVESSQNIPFVTIMEQLTPEKSIKYLKKMGITSLTDRDANLALSLGGLDKGITPLEMAGAYSTIANDGIYIEPTFYKKITNSKGTEILKTKQETRRVFSEAVCYVTKKLLNQPVVGANGTAIYCKIPGMDVAAKTGTTNDDFDRWLCGFTNYYTAVTWYGFDISETIEFNGKNPAGLIWANVMNSVHSKLQNSEFKEAKGVTSQVICKKSLKVANSGCKDVYTEYFIKGTVPDVCTEHKGSSLLDQTIQIDDETKQKIKNKVKDEIKDTLNDIKSNDQQPEVSVPQVPVEVPQEVQSTPEPTEESTNIEQQNTQSDSIEQEIQTENIETPENNQEQTTEINDTQNAENNGP